MTGAPDQGQFPEIEEGLQQLAQRQLLGLSIHQGEKDGSEVALQCRSPLQILQHLLGICIATQLHHHTHAFAVAFIADVCNSADFSVVDGLRQFFDPAGLAELVRQFGDDHGIAFVASFARLHLFGVGHAAHRDAAASMQVGVPQA